MKKEIETPFFDNVKELWIKGIGVLEYEYKSKVLKLKTPDMLKPQWEVSNQKAFATNLKWLFEEIASNLDECKAVDEMTLERYLFSLLQPFKEYADILNRDNLNRTYDVDGFDGVGSYKYWNNFDNWVWEKLQRFGLTDDNEDDEVFRGCCMTLCNLWDVTYMYANMLDAVLLERGIDLKAIQNQVGVTLLTKRDLTQIGYYLGTPERAKTLISRVAPEPEPPQPQPEGNDKVMLPEVLNTDEAKRLLDRLCKAGFAKIENGGYRWIGTKYLCAYFADRASHSLNLSNTMDKEGNIATSWKPFKALFGIDGLKGAKQNWMRLNTKFEPTGFEAIAKLFEPEG
jgi:hypothetical protein